MRALFFVLLTVAPLIAQTKPPIDNEYVRVVMANDEPHHMSEPHRHPRNRVMIYLDSGDIDLKYQDGKVEHQHWRAGQVAWSPAGGMHTSENVSDRPIRIVEIELKQGNAAMSGPPDRHAAIDNGQVRVYEGTKPPAGHHYVAVNPATGAVEWDRVPEGARIVIAELK